MFFFNWKTTLNIDEAKKYSHTKVSAQTFFLVNVDLHAVKLKYTVPRLTENSSVLDGECIFVELFLRDNVFYDHSIFMNNSTNYYAFHLDFYGSLVGF